MHMGTFLTLPRKSLGGILQMPLPDGVLLGC